MTSKPKPVGPRCLFCHARFGFLHRNCCAELKRWHVLDVRVSLMRELELAETYVLLYRIAHNKPRSRK